MFIDQDFTAKDIYTLEQKQRIHTLSEEIVMKSKGSSRWQWATGVFGFYQWLKTDAPVIFREDGMGMLGQMLGSVIPSKIEVPLPMPGMGINILPSLRPATAICSSTVISTHRFSTERCSTSLLSGTCSVLRDYLSPPACAWIMRR